MIDIYITKKEKEIHIHSYERWNITKTCFAVHFFLVKFKLYFFAILIYMALAISMKWMNMNEGTS